MESTDPEWPGQGEWGDWETVYIGLLLLLPAVIADESRCGIEPFRISVSAAEQGHFLSPSFSPPSVLSALFLMSYSLILKL